MQTNADPDTDNRWPFVGLGGVSVVEELLRTNDFVLITFVESLLKEAGIFHTVADRNTSLIEGSIGAIPRRVLVDADRYEEARQLLRDADLGQEITTDREPHN